MEAFIEYSYSLVIKYDVRPPYVIRWYMQHLHVAWFYVSQSHSQCRVGLVDVKEVKKKTRKGNYLRDFHCKTCQKFYINFHADAVYPQMRNYHILLDSIFIFVVVVIYFFYCSMSDVVVGRMRVEKNIRKIIRL
jgi:hypothetical protein